MRRHLIGCSARVTIPSRARAEPGLPTRLTGPRTGIALWADRSPAPKGQVRGRTPLPAWSPCAPKLDDGACAPAHRRLSPAVPTCPAHQRDRVGGGGGRGRHRLRRGVLPDRHRDADRSRRRGARDRVAVGGHRGDAPQPRRGGGRHAGSGPAGRLRRRGPAPRDAGQGHRHRRPHRRGPPEGARAGAHRRRRGTGRARRLDRAGAAGPQPPADPRPRRQEDHLGGVGRQPARDQPHRLERPSAAPRPRA